MLSRKTAKYFILAAMALFVASCKEEEIHIKFSHSFHVDSNGIDCINCHDFEKDKTPKRATMETCKSCHEIDTAKAGPECLKCHLNPQYEVKTAARPKTFGDIKFDHKPHLTANLKCSKCHGEMKDEKGLKANLDLPKMADCYSCHLERGGKAVDCATCHKTISKESRPSSHKQAWISSHGRESRQAPENCAICHNEEKCVSCHRDQKPANHREFWGRIEHGLKARNSRENCSVCHTDDSCSACHAKTPPRSHRPGWGTPNLNHCNSCHLPLESTSCYTCHSSIPDNQWHR